MKDRSQQMKSALNGKIDEVKAKAKEKSWPYHQFGVKLQLTTIRPCNFPKLFFNMANEVK